VESESGQAIFHKARITAQRIEARFSIDVGLITSLRLAALGKDGQPGQHQDARVQLLLSLALWKVAVFLDLLSVELSLRSECKLRLRRGKDDKGKDRGPKVVIDNNDPIDFPIATIRSGPLTIGN